MINTIFKKDIHRNIEGVVKADNLSDEAVFQEVDEYVVTNELNKKLDEFFSVYSSSIGKPTESIGVWISGFFGSGKSHLLKILSYILTDQRKHSDLIGELFLNKIDETDFELKNNIQKALKNPAKTILFNIDQKSDISTKNESDAILSVFMKVFNEMRGYYPKFGYIAKFESDLDKRGKFGEFKTKFQELSGERWETGREAIFLESDNVSAALAAVDNISKESAADIIDKYEENYSLSIEEFAKEVKSYIDAQEPNFRLVFCVDEVGQYIGDSTKLMLNLQTIIETLATVCKGQAWVVVTSQSAVSELLKSHKETENDFSKIMGRFKVKISLTSQNANEVIQKRLLDKTDEAKNDLGSIYSKVQNSLQSIIHFSDRSRQYQSYRDSDNFVMMYPFVPYQMELLQSSITALSTHNVFQGRHTSVGERSMLDIIQNVAKHISNQEIGSLASFDHFYDAIASILQGDKQTQIGIASNHFDAFTMKVLKTLFMVKYVKEFNANLDNITTLMVDSLHVNVADLKAKVQESLSRLIEEVYIQKVGDVYEFLTNVEKDIEEEIKATDIDDREITQEMVKWIYDDIIRFSKVRFSENKQDYTFERKMDDVTVKGKPEDLKLNIITPLTIDDYDDTRLTHKSMGDMDVIVALPGSFELLQDLRLFVQTNKYIPQKQSGSLGENERMLLQSKAHDNNKRRNKLLEDLKELFAESTIYFNGSKLEFTAKDPKTIVENALNTAITTTYPNLAMLRKIYEEKDISLILKQSDDLLTGSDDALNEAEQEMLNFINRQQKAHQNITISKLIETYQARPYGWYQNAVLCILASLFTRQKIELKQSGTLLGKEDALQALTNNRYFGNTIVTTATVIDDSVIKKAKEIIGELYPEASISTATSKELYDIAKAQTTVHIDKLYNYKSLSYPFKEDIETITTVLKKLEALTYENFYEEIAKLEDTLLDTKEDLLEPIFEFMQGNKRAIYDEIRQFVAQNKDNLIHITDGKANDLYALLKEPRPYRGNLVQTAKASLHHIQSLLDPLISTAREEAKAKIADVIKELQSSENFQKVEESQRHRVIKPLLDVQSQIDTTTNIDSIHQRASSESISRLFEKGLETIEELLPEEKGAVTPQPTRTAIVKLTPKTKRVLESSEDVEAFIEKLKANMLDEISSGKQIIL